MVGEEGEALAESACDTREVSVDGAGGASGEEVGDGPLVGLDGVVGRGAGGVPVAVAPFGWWGGGAGAGAPPTGEVEGLLIEGEEEVSTPPFICLSISAFSSSDIIVVATEVMSFMIDISPICGRKG